MTHRHGFTLIELSIVLVIIGLIVGGILLGQDLINAATIRAQVSQIEKYKTSVNTFRLKYGYLPGDLPFWRANQLGFFAETGPSIGTRGHQDGNGRIENFSGTHQLPGESVGFWRHLTDAQMIDGNYGTTTSGNPLVAATGSITTSAVAGTVRQVLPPAKIGRSNYIWPVYLTEKNVFYIQGVWAINVVSGLVAPDDAITPIEAHNIDVKMDDGIPLAGKVHGLQPLCSAGALYNMDPPDGDTPKCRMRIVFSQ